MEGNSVVISCTSFGAPVPTLTWFFEGMIAPFTSVEMITPDSDIMLVRRDPIVIKTALWSPIDLPTLFQTWK